MIKINRAIPLILLILLAATLHVLALELKEVVFNPNSLPDGWVMQENFTAEKSRLPEYEKKIGVSPLLGLSNQVFIVEQRCRLQVNFVQCRDTTHASQVAVYFYNKVGQVNKIVRKENIVIEIMTFPDDNNIKERVIKMLSPVITSHE